MYFSSVVWHIIVVLLEEMDEREDWKEEGGFKLKCSKRVEFRIMRTFKWNITRNLKSISLLKLEAD